ncbi:DNA-binding protein [Gluconacetobacter tumulicola]|uniref:DNA-binding protein n=1 Tax=Gluconacetobacter tumulicola TaxID=1017177 RepID=UPI0015FF2A0B|nr:DNA-binding protein [Gluconacetobacter tumulicola]
MSPTIPTANKKRGLLASATGLAGRDQPPAVQALVVPEETAASMIGLAARTLQKQRLSGDGPPYVQLTGRKIGYPIDALRRWVENRTVRATIDSGVRLTGGVA